MRPAISLCTLLAFLLAPLAAQVGPATEIDGTWELVRMTEDGKPVKLPKKVRSQIVRKGGVQEVLVDGKPVAKAKGTYKVDTGTKPPQVFFYTNGKLAAVGLYRLDGETLTVATPSDSNEKGPPRELKDGEGRTVAVYKRTKAP